MFLNTYVLQFFSLRNKFATVKWEDNNTEVKSSPANFQHVFNSKNFPISGFQLAFAGASATFDIRSAQAKLNVKRHKRVRTSTP